MHSTNRSFLSAIAILVIGSATTVRAADQPAAAPQGKIPITKLSDLPPHSYSIPDKPSLLVENKAAVLELAKAVEKDIKADLDKYDIQDQTAVRRFYGSLLTIAMLKADFTVAREFVHKVRNLQEKPAQKLTSGLVTESIIDALETGGPDFHSALRANLDERLRGLPYQEVQEVLKSTKASTEVASRNLMLGGIASSLDPAAASGKLSQDLATGILSAAYALQYFIPNKDDIVAAYTAILDANKTERKPDIWAARDVALDGSQKTTPVVVGIWDSGTDVTLFKDQLFTNTKEVPDNQKDDDKNGFVDDAHGIGWTLHSDHSTDLLFPIRTVLSDPDAYKTDLKGITDLQANLDSPEATALKQKLAGLGQDKVKPFIEGLGAYSQYAHGTHVAGIAVHGNPAARILVSRITFDYHAIPEKPTIEQANKDAAAMVQTVDYFKNNGVRAVNMSWGGDLRSIETALEQNNAGGTPDERRALARKIYDIGYKSLHDAIQGAPEVLFVIAAGNSNNDVKFDEVFPSSFQVPNVIVAGAVDQAGDQTSFTSFGNVDVFSDGFEVESFIPGGERMKLSGTSMAAPNVTNLAAKLWAVHPKLTVVQVKQFIIQGADDRKSGDKTIRLMNPKNSMTLALTGSN